MLIKSTKNFVRLFRVILNRKMLRSLWLIIRNFARLSNKGEKVDAGWRFLKRLDYDKADIKILVSSKAEHMRTNSCRKEPWTVKWLEDYYKEGQVLYDIGANVGAYSLIASAIANKNCAIYAFEPSYSTYSSLCTNILNNNCSDCIYPFQVILSINTCLSSIQLSNVDPGTASHTIATINNEQPSNKPFMTVISYRLDDMVKGFVLKKPDHIKLDVDGPEIDVLKGSLETLRHSGLKSVMAEINNDETGEADSIFKTAGFELDKVYEREKGAHNFTYRLYLRK